MNDSTLLQIKKARKKPGSQACPPFNSFPTFWRVKAYNTTVPTEWYCEQINQDRPIPIFPYLSGVPFVFLGTLSDIAER